MANTMGWKHITFTLSDRDPLSAVTPTARARGHRITGLADEDPPVEMPIIEVETETWGKDGTLYTDSTGRRGGEVKVKLLPTSVSTKHLMRKFAEIQGGRRINWEGFYGDILLNQHSLLRGGRMKMAPATISPGVTAEFTFVFEEIIPSFDSAEFEPSPAFSDFGR